ncbi:helix-turn-helix transcriptional regulator [Bradyrhizobium sp.]|uniref:helix-turn-helix transcriptional regulator n=1 Tax=Bradyrhizobium sp. TaxID=376 RepID=UPI002396C9FC|nr:helix-turn-helix transcriptional regulator [Bradyrhizobium sp.]MDE2379261.1 helix-turn-helix transcriptional regulator [Bradyrhizobium sp.]
MQPLANRFLDAITGAESWPSALAGMADGFGAMESHFTVWDRAKGCVLFSARAGRFPAEANERYAKYFHTVDTCREALIWSEIGEVFLTQAHYGEAFVKTEIYNDFLRPLGARYVIGIKLAERGPAVSMLRIHRSARNGPYSDQDVRRLKSISSNLSRSANLYFDRLQLERKAALATAALNQLNVGVVVLSPDRCIDQINAVAERILANNAVATVRAGRLVFSDIRVECTIGRLLNSAASGPPARVDAVRSLQVGEYDVCAALLDGSRAPKGGEKGDEFLLLTFEKTRGCEDLLDQMRGEFGLTYSEAAVVDQIVGGRTVQEVATANSVSLNTVKTHLKAAFAKMNVHSQSELVRLALRDRERRSPRQPFA